MCLCLQAQAHPSCAAQVGYVGNLGERVAWLAPFWILTLFPQMLTQLYFLVAQRLIGWVTLPIECALRPWASL